MPTSRAEAQSGFTLVELLAVLAILALAAGAVLQLGHGSSEAAKVRSFLIHAEAMMRDARTAAIASVTPQDVVIDTEARRLIHAARDAALDVPQGVSLDGKLARVPEAGKGRYVIRFFPSGGSTGANLPFRFRGTVYELRVNWLTGHVDVRRG
jgi:general secretion pathway protein H